MQLPSYHHSFYPYLATTYDAILTTIINFQDALKQKGDTYDAVWADEGVYFLAVEIQLVKPNEYSNIFLGLGGFRMEKIILACLGACLEPSGIFLVLVETECYGQNHHLRFPLFQGPHCPLNDS